MTFAHPDSRRVHFAEQNQYHPAYSPSYSSSTLSTPGPQTPEQLPKLVHHAYQYSPSANSFQSLDYAAGEPEIHPCLAPSPLRFNVTYDPATLCTYHPELNAVQHEQATYPKLTSITVVSRHLPWGLPIHASNGSYVTIADVIEGIYSALRIRASSREYSVEDVSRQNAIRDTFLKRVDRHLPNYALRNAEHDNGIMRVDWLTGYHFFTGLSKTDKTNVWRVGLSQ